MFHNPFMENQSRRLPLFVALAAFVLYAATMGSGLTLSGVSLTSKLAGWDATPMVGQPLVWLFTLPFQLLPLAWLPVALKLFGAVLAAATLAVLARTVQLLPWDHPWDSAGRFTSALPIIGACALCGLEFSFWQQATATCAEMLDLLLLVTVIWLLLEYQLRQQRRWLDAAMVLWGIGLVENWLMLLTFPLFIIGVIWIERIRFFRRTFVLRFAGLALAGIASYALLPIVHGLAPGGHWTFGQSWIVSLHQTKGLWAQLFHFGRAHRLLMLAVLIYYLVPTLPLLIRMRDEGTQHKPGVDRFQIWLYRALRLGLLLACCWLAFDPAPAARQMLHREPISRMPMLAFDYLTALGAAFLLGNLILSAHIVTRNDYDRPRNQRLWRWFARVVAAVGVALVAAGLVARNAPAIVHSNFHPLEEFGDLAAQSLPPGHGVILSDHPERTCLLRMGLARNHLAANWLVVDTELLPSVPYRAGLEKRLPAGWLTDRTGHELTRLETLRLLDQVARTNRLFYLHPSFGFFFERFYLEPTGSVYEMKLRGKDPLDIPALPETAVTANEQFWTHAWDQQLAPIVRPARSRSAAPSKRHLGLVPAPEEQDLVLGDLMSVTLESWAVTLQKQGHLREAQVRFEEALRLNTNNLSARSSLVCNTNLQAGNKLEIADLPRLGTQNVKNDGPFDEPVSDYLLGLEFLNHGLRVQAVEQLERARTLAPNSLTLELSLANAYNQLQMPDRSRPLINHIREQVQKSPANSTLDLDLALLDTYSWLLQTNVANAREALESVVSQHPDDPKVADRVIGAYLAFNDVTNAWELVEERLAKTPDDIATLNAKAAILLQNGHAADAMPVLDRVIALTNQPAAHVSRAFACILLKDFASASNELSGLDADTNTAGVANFGFALVARHFADTNSARRYLQLCVSNTAPGASMWYQANELLHQLDSPAAK
jgi:tetratricopeptide (TPR) repeat protein